VRAIELDGETVVLVPVARETAAELLAGRMPADVVFADGYPSRYSLEVMDLLAGPRAAAAGPHFHSWFVVRRDDGAVVGELGYSFDSATATASVGYSIVEPSWGRGFATDGVRALLEHLRADPDVERIEANTLVEHVASRRVMEKAGMRFARERLGEEDGELVELVFYELAPEA
jgi:RimJ/RimL family protein N-acetyltransferase